jgi:acetate kinase
LQDVEAGGHGSILSESRRSRHRFGKLIHDLKVASPVNVLVVNCGSSSLKVSLIDPTSGNTLRHALAERLQQEGALLELDDGASEPLAREVDHGAALDRVLERFGAPRIAAVGHRVVHGGEHFSESVVIDEAALGAIEACAALAPLHNPANLVGIRAAQGRFADVPHVAVFDTAFHQTMPPQAYLYALPYELYERHQVRRYGFHGTSHRFVAGEAAARLGRRLEELQLITAHLGNGCSACAVRDGRSVDTTMGLTPLEGLMMGTRSGDVDPNLHQFLVENTGRTLAQVTELLNRQSGLLGVSGLSNDMRALLEAREQGNERAKLAVDLFCYRLAKAILALCGGLERVDALIFTGGIGEHAAAVRAETLSALRVLGASLDPELNRTHGASAAGRITRSDSKLLALVVPTNEELVIAREAWRLCASA